jgi:isopenicillin-N N-acyltransferase like protein
LPRRTCSSSLAVNARGELSRGKQLLDESRDGCASFALTARATGDGHVYGGQNWDWRAGASDTVIMLLRVQPLKPTIVMQTEAAQIRGVLDSADVDKPLQAIFTSPQTNRSYVLLTHRERVVIDLEATGRCYGWPYATDGVLVRLTEVR